ncbi:MAG: hypothetical protein ACOYT8_03750 [Candidatus Dependentiae bacterium]
MKINIVLLSLFVFGNNLLGNNPSPASTAVPQSGVFDKLAMFWHCTVKGYELGCEGYTFINKALKYDEVAGTVEAQKKTIADLNAKLKEFEGSRTVTEATNESSNNETKDVNQPQESKKSTWRDKARDASMVLQIASSGVNIGRAFVDVYHYYRPHGEKAARDSQGKMISRQIEADLALSNCMLKHNKAEIDEDYQLPKPCVEEIKKFISLVGEEYLSKKQSAFNRIKGK